MSETGSSNYDEKRQAWAQNELQWPKILSDNVLWLITRARWSPWDTEWEWDFANNEAVCKTGDPSGSTGGGPSPFPITLLVHLPEHLCAQGID